MARRRVPIKQSTSFRLTEDAQRLLDGLVEKLGIGKSNVVEQAIRQMARREKVTLAKGDADGE